MTDAQADLTAGLRVSSVRCFCGKAVRLSARFQQGTCKNCGAYFAMRKTEGETRMIWAYGEGKRVIEQPEIIDWESAR